MARDIPTFSEGVLPTLVSGQRNVFVAKVAEQIISHQNNGEQAWEIAEDLSGTYFDKVFHSIGDRSLGSGSSKGDTDIWFRLTQYGVGDDFRIRTYQDWSPTSSTGFREASTSSFKINMNDTQGIKWWSVVSAYEIVFIANQNGTFFGFFAGQLIRPFGSRINGVARLTSQSGTGSGVVLGVDRDISANLQVNQKLWLVNQTPDGSPLQSVGIDLVDVTVVAPTQITVNGVVNTYAVGSLVGYDPQPVYNKQVISDEGSLYMSSDMSGGYSTAVAQIGTINSHLDGSVVDSEFGPGPDQLYPTSHLFAHMTNSPAGFRGIPQHMRTVVYGFQGDRDLIQENFDNNEQYKILYLASPWYTGFVQGYGKGAE